MMIARPTVGVAPGTFTLRVPKNLGWPNTIARPCPTNPTGWYITDPFTNSVNPSVGFPADHAVGYDDPKQLAGLDPEAPTLFGVRLDILGVVGGIAIGTAFVLAKIFGK